jgi:mono/diheme cytochrome c family protein
VNRAPALVLALACCACASRAPYTRAGGKLGVLVVRTESPAALDGERVIAAADDGTRRLLLTAQGAWVLRGSAAERTPGARRWKKAALIPAADGRGTWCVGLDQAGRLWRVRPGADLEEASDRYGLGHEQIHDVASAGGRLVAFLVDGAVAVADGRRVLRFPAPGARSIAGGGRLVALVFPDRVETLDFSQRQDDRPRRRRYPLAARAAGVDARGALYAATDRAVYRAEAGTLRLAYVADAGIRWLTAAGPRVWFADGETLLSLDDSVAVTQPAPLPAANASAAGDGSLWMVGQGRPTRIVPSQASATDERWARQVSPVFASACSECHRPDGKSGVDLSTASAWLEARDEILQRVVVRRTMPPAGRAMSEEDRATIAAWMRGL